MTFKTIVEVNTSKGIHTLFTYAAEIVPIFIPLILFAIFIITGLGTYFAQIRLRGEGDFPSSLAVAGWLTAIIAFILNLAEGLIDLLTLSSTFFVAVICTMILFFSKKR